MFIEIAIATREKNLKWIKRIVKNRISLQFPDFYWFDSAGFITDEWTVDVVWFFAKSLATV